MAPARKTRPSGPTRKKAKTAGRRKVATSRPSRRATSGQRKPGEVRRIRESRAARQARLGHLLQLLQEEFPAPECALRHDNPLQLLVATILSAQCTDERVNQVTPALFRKYRTAREFAASPPGELEEDIRSTGFFNNKARNIRGACQLLADLHDGIVPDTMDELLALPGVARKTANVVLGTAFGIASGVVVDTHVTRLANLLGLTRHQDAVKIERDLQALVPPSEWINFSHQLILHGRSVCIARRPKCGECSLRPHCPSAFVP